MSFSLASVFSLAIAWQAMPAAEAVTFQQEDVCAEAARFYQQQRFGIAISYLTRCFEDETAPDPDRILFFRAMSYFGLDQRDEAMADLNAAIEINQEEPTYIMARAHLYLLEGRYGEAVVDYDYYASVREEGPQERTALEAIEGFWAPDPRATNAGRFACPTGPLRIDTEPPDKYESLRLNGRHLIATVLSTGRSAFVIRYLNEDRRSPGGELVAWLLYMPNDFQFIWRRTDWRGFTDYTPIRTRCIQR